MSSVKYACVKRPHVRTATRYASRWQHRAKFNKRAVLDQRGRSEVSHQGSSVKYSCVTCDVSRQQSRVKYSCVACPISSQVSRNVVKAAFRQPVQDSTPKRPPKCVCARTHKHTSPFLNVFRARSSSGAEQGAERLHQRFACTLDAYNSLAAYSAQPSCGQAVVCIPTHSLN